MSELTARWAQTLTAGQRTAWNLYAASVSMLNKLGESINLSGYNHYLRSNVLLLQYGGPPIDDGPTIFELPAADPAFAITASEAAQEISFAYDDTMDWAVETDSHMLLFQGSPQNAQINFFNGPWRKCSIASGNDGGAPPSPKVAAAVFAIAEGQRLWAYARILRKDGRLSAKFTASCFCAA